jgi:hypothetical protein
MEAVLDGMTTDELPDYLRSNWHLIREDLLAGRYRPQLVRRHDIPKASGGTRSLGIPTVSDRFIQQALLQVLQPIYNKTFSDHSHGFRPGRSAHGAVKTAQRYIQEGRLWVVDIDLEKFCDRVNHDVLMGRLAKRIGDKQILRLVRRFDKLHLQVNASKSAVARVWNRPFLGFAFWVAPGKKVQMRVAPESLKAMKARVRQITGRNNGRSLAHVAEELRMYLLGWKGYFQLAVTAGVFKSLDEWIRHRLRAMQLKPWKRGTTTYLELRKRGLSSDAAAVVAVGTRRWWHTSARLLNTAIPNTYFERLGVPRLAPQ